MAQGMLDRCAQVTAGMAEAAKEEAIQLRAEMLESGHLHNTTTARLRQAQQVRLLTMYDDPLCIQVAKMLPPFFTK